MLGNYLSLCPDDFIADREEEIRGFQHMCACFQEAYFLNTQVFITSPGKRRSEIDLSALTGSHLLRSEYSTLPRNTVI